MNISTHKLSNGLTHIHIQKDSDVTTAIFMVGVGSKNEEKRISGISHYLEHMFFKGTAKRNGSVEIAEFIEEIGGSFNAFTGKEYTGYYAVVAKQHTDRALDFVSDLVLTATFPENEMEKEKGVVIEEMNMYQDIPMKLVPEKFEELLYGDSPSGWQIIGNKESVSGLTHKDITDYVGKHYTVANSVVVTVGSHEGEGITKEVEGYFSSLKDGEKSTKEKPAEVQKKPEILLHHKKTDQTHLCLGFRGTSLSSDDRYPLSLLAAALGGGMSSRLFTEIREKRGLCYYVRASQELYTDSGYFVIQAGIDNTKVDEALKAMIVELKKVITDGITEKELKKVKEYKKGNLALALEGSQETAVYMASQFLLEGTTESIQKIWKKIDAVEPEDVRRVINTYFKEESLNLALIGPFEDKKEFEEIITLK